MPTTAPLAPGPFERLRRGYGAGPFSQMMLNMDLAPLPASLIDLTGGPETWLKAIRRPIELDPNVSFLHGLTSLPERAIGKIGLNRGWFSDVENPAEFFGPHFAEAKYKDIPQPIIAAPRAPGMAKYDPLIEYSPAWAGKEVVEQNLDRLQRELNSGYFRAYPQELRSSIKDIQHQISKPGDITIPPERLTYVNPLTGQRGPFQEAFQRLMELGHTRMNPEEFKALINSLKNPLE